MLKVEDVADYIVSRSIETGNYIDNVRLQLVFYFIEGFYYRRYNDCLTNDSSFRLFGTNGLLRNLSYYKYCAYGASPILIAANKPRIPVRYRIFIDDCLDYLSNYSTYALNYILMHAVGSPARHVDETMVIWEWEIRDFFCNLKEDKNAD